MPNRVEENSRLTDRKEYLRQNRLEVSCDLFHYTKKVFFETREYVEEILQAQMNEIVRQFRDQPCWMGLMFWEGLSPGLPVKKMPLPDEAALVTCVDALQISLMLFRLLTHTVRLSEDEWLLEENRILHEDGGEEEEIVLQGCVAGISDYIVVAACQEMQKIGSANVRNCILAQYGAAINQIYREHDILRKGSLDEDRLRQLREIWRDGQSMSAYYLGVVCTGGGVDCARDAILKEFEFWKSLQWLQGRTRGPDENLKCCGCCTDEQLAALERSKDLTEELRQLLQFCSNNLIG